MPRSGQHLPVSTRHIAGGGVTGDRRHAGGGEILTRRLGQPGFVASPPTWFALVGTAWEVAIPSHLEHRDVARLESEPVPLRSRDQVLALDGFTGLVVVRA